MAEKTSQPTVTQSSSSSPIAPRHFSGRRKPLAILIILIAITVITIGAVAWHRHNVTTRPKGAVTAGIRQSFSKTSLFTLTGSTAGTGATFEKPAEFGGSTSAKVHAAAEEVTSNRSYQTVQLGELDILSTPAPKAFTTTYLQNYDKLMAKAATDQKSQQPLHDYAAQSITKGYTVKVTAVKPYTSANIKSHAWEVSLSATPTKATDSTTLQAQKGVLIVALGQSAYYHFVFMVADYNWDASQNAIQQVLGSLKIDK